MPATSDAISGIEKDYSISLSNFGEGSDSLSVSGTPPVGDPPGDPPGSGPNYFPPIAVDDSYSVTHDRELAVIDIEGLLINDSDADGNVFYAYPVDDPTHGSIDFQTHGLYGDGAFFYVPADGFVGTDSFTYRVFDGTYWSNVATVTIHVTNSAPIGVADSYSIGEDGILAVQNPNNGVPGTQIGVLANDMDADNDPKTAQLVSDVSNGTLVFYDDGTFIYKPKPNFIGSDSFSYSLTDGIVSTLPVQVSITVGSAVSFVIDIDGRDGTTEEAWMHEWDELTYGMYAGVGSTDSQILLRETQFRTVHRRELWWNPEVLSIAGVTQPGIMSVSPRGDIVLPVTAIQNGYQITSIDYYVDGIDDATGLGIASITTFIVVEMKAVLRSIQFISDHDVIRMNKTNITGSGTRYNDIEFVRKPSYNAPITHTYGEKLEVKVTADTRGIPQNTPIVINGTGQTVSFTKSTTQTTPNSFTTNILSTNPLESMVMRKEGTLDWTVTVNGRNLFMGRSGKHVIYLTFAIPKNPDGSNVYHVTDIRMDTAVPHAGQGLAAARLAANTQTPTTQRIAYQILQLHQFNLNRNPAYDTGPFDSRNYWKVPATWSGPTTGPMILRKGSDCISGAQYTSYVSHVTGLPNLHGFTISAVEYRSKSEAEPKIAEIGNLKTDPIVNATDGRKAGLFTRGANPLFNYFEACVVVIKGQEKFYLPSGAGPVYFDHPDKVLTIFGTLSWWSGYYDAPPEIRGQRKPDPNPITTWNALAGNCNID